MSTINVACPYCGSYRTEKSSKGKITRSLSIVGSVVGGALLDMATGIPGILGANAGTRITPHQFYCKDCGATFKVKLGATGEIIEIIK